MKVVKSFVTVLSMMAALSVITPLIALSEEAGAVKQAPPEPQAASSESKDTDARELQAIEQTLRKALEKSEADKVRLEKRYNELSAREAQAREEAIKLSAEKDAIEKSCPTKVSPEAKSQSETKGKKKKSIHKWWASGKGSSGHAEATGSAPKKDSKAKKHVRSAKKRVAAKKSASVQKKTCAGAVVSMASVQKALKGNRELAGKNLSGLNLAGMNLVGVNLRGACLAKTNLERADLAEADLERAELTGANLSRASLRLANVNAAKLDGAILDNTIWKDSRVCLEGSVGVCRDVIP